MSDLEDDGIDEAFKGFGEDPATVVTPPANPDNSTPPAPVVPPPAEPPKPAEGEEDADKNKPPTNPEGTPPAGDPKPPAPEGDKPTGEEAKPGEGKPADPAAPATPPTPPAPEEPKPLTEDRLREIINETRTEERVSTQALDTATKDVLEAYYPDGLSNTLVDQATGKELKTPQDVIDASNGELSMEQATQWLMNEQYKLDSEVNKIREDARGIAETTLKFQNDGKAVLQKYEPVFKAYPQLQTKVWTQFKKLVKADEEKGVILSAPDMMEFYDTVLDPYRLAVEYATKNPGTNPTPAAPEPPAPTPGAEDRLDEGGDGGVSPVDDPNDFAQQVSKELAKGL